MTSVPEQRLSHLLRTVLADLPNGATIPDSEQFQKVLTGLQFYIPVVLGEIYREWTFKGLDDVLPVLARKTGDAELEVFGICCFVADQTLTPLHVHLQLAATDDEISWLECRLGERERDGMVRKPYRYLKAMMKRMHKLEGQIEMIDWVYKVTFGVHRPSQGPTLADGLGAWCRRSQ